MKKILVLTLIFSFSIFSYAQKIEIEHSDKTPKPSELHEGSFKVFLVNDTNNPIVLFRSHYKEYGGCETTTEKQIDGEVVSTTNMWKPMDTNSRFDNRAFSTIKANSKKFIATLSINDKKPGTYLLKYQINQDPNTVNLDFAKNGQAVALAKSIAKMDINGTFEYTIKPLEKKPFEAREISYEELKKQKTHKDFAEAIFDPSGIFSMNLTINDAKEAEEFFEKLVPLKNIRRLTLTFKTTESIKIPATIGQLPLMEFYLYSKSKSLGIMELPADFLNAGTLRKTWISGLSEGDLPFLAKQTKLEELNLEKVVLQNFDWIGSLTELTRLGIYSSSIAALPVSFKNLTKLTSLIIRQNDLTTIDHIPNTENLKVLNLERNKITKISGDFSGMTNLGTINLSFNNLTQFPLALTDAIAVRNLNLTNNKITDLPSEFSNLKVVKELNLSNNNFSDFPTVLGKLPKLQDLRINNNKITKLPNEVTQLKKLRDFRFENNKINSLPDGFMEMTLYHIYSKGNLLDKKQIKKLKKQFGRAFKS